MVNFPAKISDSDSHSPALLDLFISSNASICSTKAFLTMGNSDVVVSVYIDVPSNSKQDVPFDHIAYNYSDADWDSHCNYLAYVPREDSFTLGPSAATSEFCEWFQVDMDVYPSL